MVIVNGASAISLYHSNYRDGISHSRFPYGDGIAHSRDKEYGEKTMWFLQIHRILSSHESNAHYFLQHYGRKGHLKLAREIDGAERELLLELQIMMPSAEAHCLLSESNIKIYHE